MKEKKTLRLGFTTGACAAAAAKAACIQWLYSFNFISFEVARNLLENKRVEIYFPDGQTRELFINDLYFNSKDRISRAGIIKDAGDDPDVTHGALIAAEVVLSEDEKEEVQIKGGEGVGIVTRPGLPIGVGDHAINPVPRLMIEKAVREAMSVSGFKGKAFVTIHVPEGKYLSKKTLNPRLGIVNGISILGTTGIVKPLSSEAYAESIALQLKVARATNVQEVVISTGRSSEKAHMNLFNYPEQSYILGGNLIDYSVYEAKRIGFTKIVIATQFVKLLKMSEGFSSTHSSYVGFDPCRWASLVGTSIPYEFNTGRELFFHILSMGTNGKKFLEDLCRKVAKIFSERYGILVSVKLFDYKGPLVAEGGSEDE
ncbi:MAG: cobalt-precorrin-5B (C(1))-methyltransferase CbiD [Deltaproteobacteria bacterium]|nr:cobalt-precorrin-5B (C(1))-methyltransferase CbiD [Deltaproteobacteria bacterium]